MNKISYPWRLGYEVVGSRIRPLLYNEKTGRLEVAPRKYQGHATRMYNKSKKLKKVDSND